MATLLVDTPRTPGVPRKAASAASTEGASGVATCTVMDTTGASPADVGVPARPGHVRVVAGRSAAVARAIRTPRPPYTRSRAKYRLNLDGSKPLVTIDFAG